MALVSPSDELISDEWFAEVENIVGANDGDDNGSVGRESRRVPEFVAEGKADAYSPQVVSLGPYYHSALKDAPLRPHGLSRISHMEMNKLNCLKSAARDDPDRIRNFFENTVQPKKSELEQFYNLKLETQDGFRKFGWMMTVDAFFLYQFLKDSCDRNKSRHHSATGSIKCDIVKLENQLPLFLLDEVHSTLQGRQAFDEFLRSLMASLCSFEKFECSAEEKIGEQKHLLAYMHKYVSSFLRMDDDQMSGSCFLQSQMAIEKSISTAFLTCCFPRDKTDPSDFRMNARKLIKYGITLTPFALGKNKEKIRFDRYSTTLYLPRLTVTDMFTEVVLRNLLALEFNETSEETVVTQYVELMKSLIVTAKDVKVLRKRDIIVPGSSMISDDYIAAMWKDISKPFFAGSVQPSIHFQPIKKALHRRYYIVKGIAKGFRLVQTPFKIVSWIVGLG